MRGFPKLKINFEYEKTNSLTKNILGQLAINH